MQWFKRVLTFNDVALVPQYNDGLSRMDPMLNTFLTRDVTVDIPIVNSPMDTVISLELAKVMRSYGSIPIFHRFYKDPATMADLVKEYGHPCFISCGAGPWGSLFSILNDNPNIVGVNIDIAHGHSRQMLDSLDELKRKRPEHKIIAGAVCTPEGYEDLVRHGADAVRVGIGCGSACTTRMVTGFGVSQFSAIYECARSYSAKRYGVPIISDGGISNSRDLVLAIAAGANCVALGKLLALTHESAAPKRGAGPDDAIPYVEAKYRGLASKEFQEDFYGKMRAGTTAEGEAFWAPVLGSASSVLDQLLGGLRSGMVYGGARDIPELQASAQFVQVTPAYKEESLPRPPSITQ